MIGILKAAFVPGMLAKDEFDQRVGQAFAARAHADLTALTALTADIPAGLIAGPSPREPGAQMLFSPHEKRSRGQLPSRPDPVPSSSKNQASTPGMCAASH